MNLTSLTVALAMCFPAFFLAARRSPWLMEYLILVVAANRGVRRFVDYQQGFFDPYSPISLTPIVVSGFAALLVFQLYQRKSHRLGRTSRKVIRWYLIAIGLAFAVGLVRNRLGAVYELGGYLAPLGMMGMAMMFSDQPKVIRRWTLSAALIGVGVAGYGLWQFYTIPPWDAFWVRAVGFEGYLGTLEPTKMTLFATLPERGPAAMFFAGTLIILLLGPRLLGPLRWPAAALVLAAMLFTYSRTTVIHVTLACAAFPVVSRGKGLGIIVVIGLVFVLGGDRLLGFLPNQEFVADRYATLGAIQDDGSFQGRIKLLGIALGHAATEPLGLGLGSHGLAGRVGGGGGEGDSTGFLVALRTFGWHGFILMVMVLRQLWISSTKVLDERPNDRNTALFRAWFVSGIVVLFSGNWLAGASFFWVLGGYVVGQADQLAQEQADRESDVPCLVPGSPSAQTLGPGPAARSLTPPLGRPHP